MKPLMPVLAVLLFLTLTPAFAQFGSLRVVSGLGLAAGYGTVGLELEIPDYSAVVYPRGSLAYTLGVGGLYAPPYWGFNFQAGGILYLEPDWRGLFGALRGGVGLLAQNNVGTFVGTLALTGGYRWVLNRNFDLGLEGGLFIATADYGNVSAIGITPTLAASVGYRF